MVEGLICAITGDVSNLECIFTGDVTGWSPIARTSSLQDMYENLSARRGALDAVALKVTSLFGSEEKWTCEWRLTAVHSAPLPISEGVALDPGGAKLELPGSMVAEFRKDRIASFRVYFDVMSMIEQLVIPI